MKKKDIVVIGLGRFGNSVIETLLDYNCNIIALDNDEKKIEKIANKVSYASVIDTTDEESLISAGVKNVDNVIVSIGEDVEGCIMTVAALKNIGVKEDKIITKSFSDKVSTILNSLGIKNIVRPEKEAGKRTAFKVMHTLINDFIGLDDNHMIVEIIIRKKELLNTSLKDLEIRRRFNINIVAIKREEYFFIPGADSVLKENDCVYMIGEDKDISAFERYLMVN